MPGNGVHNGQAEYGTVHAMEEAMREAGAGVFEPKSRSRAPANKAMKGAPKDKALSSMTKAELFERAKAGGVAVESDDNKADLIAKIEKAGK